jgi:hypothetical protein
VKAGGEMALLAACIHAGFFLGLFFNHEDGGDLFPRNVVEFQRTTRRYIPEDTTLRLIFCFTRPAPILHKFLRDMIYQLNVQYAELQ